MESTVELASGTPSPCPDRSTLVDFDLGRLPAPETDRVAEHLSSCQSCRATLSKIEVETIDDPEILRIMRGLDGPPLPDGPAFAELERRGLRMFPARADRGDPVPTTDPGIHSEELAPAPGWQYEQLEEIDRGGMGIVYRAFQVRLKRWVALKVIRAGLGSKSEAVSRFVREGEAIARLVHPNVVQVYELDVHGGLPYFSMELMEGGSLHDRLRSGGPMAPHEAAGVVRAIALAIAYAHREGVIHRDLKPSNILLAADGTPKVGDFGLAKLLDAGPGGPATAPLTDSDVILGTVNYMAPEQAIGSAEIAAPTDVYALGAILYETLTGRPPFSGATKLEVLERVRYEPPTPPSEWRPEVPTWLEAICLKCLEKIPARRYLSAQALADDLDLWLRDERPRGIPGWFARTRRRLREHAVAVLLILALLAIGTAASLRDPDAALRRTRSELARGRAVTLIGPTGGPAWSRWRAGESSGHSTLAADRTFTLNSWAHALLELVPDPQSDRYRINAQVRHEKSDHRGAVGLYFAHRVYRVGPADLQFFGELTFNAVRGDADFRAQLPPEFSLQGPVRDNAPQLFPHFLAEEADRPGFESRLAGIYGPRFKPHGEWNGVWHDLELVVTPERVSARWDGEPFGIATAEFQEKIRKDLMNHPPPPAAPLPRGFVPPFERRGGLGLYVFRGSASFRAVTITPQ